MAVMTGVDVIYTALDVFEGANSKKVGSASVAGVMKEIRCPAGDPKVKYLFVCDETFSLNREGLRAFCEE